MSNRHGLSFWDQNLLQNTGFKSFQFHCGLIGLDFGDDVTNSNLIADFLQPAAYSAFRHRVGETRHGYFTHGASYSS
jgi:hypothetical protein